MIARIARPAFAGWLALAAPAFADEAAVAEAVQSYMDFATYEQGIILPQQLDKEVFTLATFIDTRDAEQYAQGHIDGAINIEWRDVPSRLEELPESGMVIFYCNTGTLSAQATFAARLLGRDNVLVLQSGFLGWQESAAYKP